MFVSKLTFNYHIWWMDWNDEWKMFLGVMVHHLGNISLKSHCLAAAEMYEQHTVQYTSEVEKVLSEWEIDKSKIVTVVTDNGANVVAAVIKSFGKSRHIPCFAHTINLVAAHTVGRKTIKPIISKVREIVKWIKNSFIISYLLKKKTILSRSFKMKNKKINFRCYNTVEFCFFHDKKICWTGAFYKFNIVKWFYCPYDANFCRNGYPPIFARSITTARICHQIIN